jgi:hypothetical protein
VLLALAQHPPVVAPLGDVERGAEHAHRAPIPLRHEARARLQQPQLAVGAPDAELDRERLAAGERRHPGVDHGAVVGVDHRHERRVGGWCPRLVHTVDAALLARPAHGVGGEIDLPASQPGELLDEIHLLLAIAQRLPDLVQLGEEVGHRRRTGASEGSGCGGGWHATVGRTGRGGQRATVVGRCHGVDDTECPSRASAHRRARDDAAAPPVATRGRGMSAGNPGIGQRCRTQLHGEPGAPAPRAVDRHGRRE